MEIGSFIEMQFDSEKEYYRDFNTARLNSGRAAIYHSLRLLQKNSLYIPYYQCESVRNFLTAKGIRLSYYRIDECFTPMLFDIPSDSAILLVNYYGIMSFTRIEELASRYKNVIIDNSQAFFAKPVSSCLNIYSARKFIGSPDGAYVIGENAAMYLKEYEQDYSSDTAVFLLNRIEYGCEGRTYEARMENEKRIEASGIRRMSQLTYKILDGTNYSHIIEKRRENYEAADRLFQAVNILNANLYYDSSCIPMVYPLAVEDDMLLPTMLKNKIFQGHWWSYLLKELQENWFEYWLSRYMIPITIDQRYGHKELEYMRCLIDGRKKNIDNR